MSAPTSSGDAIGTVTVHGGKVTITVGAERQIFDHPVGKDIDAQMIIDLRRMLTGAGLVVPSGITAVSRALLDCGPEIQAQRVTVFRPTGRPRGV